MLHAIFKTLQSILRTLLAEYCMSQGERAYNLAKLNLLEVSGLLDG